MMRKLLFLILLFACFSASSQVPGFENMPRIGLPLKTYRLWSDGSRHLVVDKDSANILYGRLANSNTWTANQFFNYTATTTAALTGSGGNTNLHSSASTGTWDVYFPDAGGTVALTTQVPTEKKLTGSGNGTSTTISIAHGLSGIGTSSTVVMTPMSAAAAGVQYVTIDATNVNFVYSSAPVSGTSNLIYSVIIRP